MKQFVGRVFSQYAMRPFRGDFFHYAEMVEAAGIEPASANPLPSVLHAYPRQFI